METCNLRDILTSRRTTQSRHPQTVRFRTPPQSRPNDRAQPGERSSPRPASAPAVPESYHMPQSGSPGPFYVVLEGRDVGIWSGW
jgi:hypothetical protein